MPVRDKLSAVLRGDPADLSPDARAVLETLAHEVHSERELAHVRDECAARLKQPDATPGVEYLLANVCALNGEIERANQTLLALGERLASESAWEELAAVADHALDLEETQAGARLLVQAHEGLGKDPARLEALERARAIVPDDLELGLLLAVRLGEAGQSERRRALLASLLPHFAREGRHAGLEEAALEFVEHQDVSALVALIHTLPEAGGEAPHRESAQLVSTAFPAVAAAGRAGEVLEALRRVAAQAAERDGIAAAEPFREAIVTALRQGPGRTLPQPDAVFEASAVGDASLPLLPALERFDAISLLAPGRAVHHDSFGAGRIASNDGVTVAIDFAHARGHRMPYDAARRTLSPIAEDDLRLMRVHASDELNRLLADAPAEVVWRALKSLGGAAEATKLKMFLVGSHLVPPREWNAFWRRAKAAAQKDPRIDTTRAYEQHYSVATGEQAAAPDQPPLPALEPRKSVRANLTRLRKFLAQHPGAEQALAGRFGKYVSRAVLDAEGEIVDRARAGLMFARWFPERAPEWTEVLRGLWEQGLSISDLSGEDEQLDLLGASHAAGVEADAILGGLDSRFSSVRAEARRLREQLDPDGRRALRTSLVRHATRHPGAALRLIENELSRTPPPDDPWRLLLAALSLIENRPKPSVADKVLRWIAPDADFDRLLAGSTCPEDDRLPLRVLLRQWHSSDRYLFPALEAAERLGLTEEAEAVRAARQKRTSRLFDRVGKPSEDADIPVMTRATFERLKGELERLERELRTTIPASIQKARELGDLKENAEYHSAKLKQANVSKLVASLQIRLSRARFVEDASFVDGQVGLGTEVVLESDDDVVTYWILGEDEHHHGEHVVSHQAPVGRALVGRTIGDEVELGESEVRRRYRIVSVERKLPDADAGA